MIRVVHITLNIDDDLEGISKYRHVDMPPEFELPPGPSVTMVRSLDLVEVIQKELNPKFSLWDYARGYNEAAVAPAGAQR